jgi:Zinc-binding dehydrogenase
MPSIRQHVKVLRTFRTLCPQPKTSIASTEDSWASVDFLNGVRILNVTLRPRFDRRGENQINKAMKPASVFWILWVYGAGGSKGHFAPKRRNLGYLFDYYIKSRISGFRLVDGLESNASAKTSKASFSVKFGDTIVVHAAAGGVGLLLVQWARLLGCRVIGIVSTEEKAQLAADHGCHHPLVLHRGGGFAEGVRALTAGEGVPVVYDSIGRDTFEESLRCLRPNATLVSFGSASGPVPPVDLFQLNQMGSLHVTSAAFAWFVRDRRELLRRASDLFDVVLRGAVRITVNQRYPLADAAHAHRDLETRRTSGFSVLLP